MSPRSSNVGNFKTASEQQDEELRALKEQDRKISEGRAIDEKKFEAAIVNEAGFSTKNLVDITQIVSDIYNGNSLYNIFSFKILAKEEGREINSFDGLFLALVNEDRYSNLYRKPGQASLNAGGKVEGWQAYRGAYISYVNAGLLTKDYGFGKDWNWAIGYVIAHEFLHQLLLKADLSVNKINVGSSWYDGTHNDQYLNLNMDGKMVKQEISKGRNTCSEACRIVPEQLNLLIKYIY